MIKKIIYILPLLIIYSCSSTKVLEKEKRVLIIQSNGISFISPDIFVTYLNIEKEPISKNIKCETYRDSLIKRLKEIIKRNNIENYKIEKGVLKQNNAFEVIEGKSDKFLGNYCQSSLAITVYKQEDSHNIYPELLQEFNVATEEYYSSKMDSLNLAAYKNAIKNADLLSNYLLNELRMKSKKLIKITNITESNNDTFLKVNDYPKWIYGDTFLQAIGLLKDNLIIARKEIIVEYEID